MMLKSSLSSLLSHYVPSSVHAKGKTKFHYHFRFLFSLDCFCIFHVAAAVIYFLHLVQDYHFIAKAIAVLVLFISFVYLFCHSSIFRCKILIVLTKPLSFTFNCYFKDCHNMGTLKQCL